MPTNRNVVLVNNEIYHIFNRGVEKRQIFMNSRDYGRAIETFRFYQYSNPSVKYSKFLALNTSLKKAFLENLTTHPKLVEIIAYCLMPNHFHFLLQQINENGISKFIANFTNSYTKYFNTKYERVGNLVQGPFKAVHIEKNEQLLHVNRYIHLNPVTAFLIKPEQLRNYKWSSYRGYLDSSGLAANSAVVLGQFKTVVDYERFVLDQVDYARTLDSIKHLILE